MSDAVRKQLGVVPGLGREAGKALGDNLSAGVDQAARKVESAAKKVEAARRKEADAAGKVRTAEAQLEALRERGVADAGRLTAAEERVAKAKRDHEAASKTLTRTVKDESAAQGKLADAQKKVADSSEDAAAKGGRFSGWLQKLKGDSAAGASGLGAVSTKLGSLFRMAGGASALALPGVALAKGFGRLKSLDEAEAKLKGLGRTSEEAKSIMESVNEAVTGTAFGLDEAAGSAAVFSTMGVATGEDMTRVMKLLSDTTAQAGSSFGEMTPIFQKVVAAGGLTTETFDQLNERGTGVGEALSKHLGIPLDQIRDKAKEINFEDFAAAMEKNIGGAAQKMGDTFSGAVGNMGAALGRVGEKVLRPLFDFVISSSPSIIAGINKVGEAGQGIVEAVMPRLQAAGELFKQYSGWIVPIGAAVGAVVVAFKAWTTAVAVWRGVVTAAIALQTAWNVVMSANPIGLVVLALVGLGAALVTAYNRSETFRNIVQGAWEGVKGAFSAAWGVIKTVIDGIGAGINWLWQSVIQPAFQAMVFPIRVWWAAAQIVFKLAQAAVRSVGDVFLWLWRNAVEPAWEGIRAVIDRVWQWVQPVWEAFKLGLVVVGQKATELWQTYFAPAWEGIKSAVSAAWEFIRPIFDRIKTGFDNLKTGLVTAANAIREGISAAFSGLADIIKTPIRVLGQFLQGIPASIMGVDIPGAATLSRWGDNLAGLRAGGAVRDPSGRLRGPGTGTSDSIFGVNAAGVPIVRVSDGEGVVKKSSMDRGGDALVDALNAGWTPSPELLHRMIPGFNRGGPVREGAIPDLFWDDVRPGSDSDGRPPATRQPYDGSWDPGLQSGYRPQIRGGYFDQEWPLPAWWFGGQPDRRIRMLQGFKAGGVVGNRRKSDEWLTSLGLDPDEPLGPGRAQEGGLQQRTVALSRTISAMFPDIKTIGGYRQDRFHWHPSGLALDVMIPGGTTRGGRNPAGKELGDRIWQFVKDNADALGVDVKSSLWQTDAGGDHYDHLHLVTTGGGKPERDQEVFLPKSLRDQIRAAQQPARSTDSAVSSSAAPGSTPVEPDVASAGSSGGGSGSYPTTISGWSGFAAEQLIGGQVKSALDVLGVPDSPGWLQGIGEFVGGLSISDAQGNKIFGGSGGSGLSDIGNLFGGGGTEDGLTPLAARPTAHGTTGGAAPGPMVEGRPAPQPGVVYNIAARDTEDAFIRAQRQERERAAAKLARF